jgi:hypothetical protein
VKFVPKIGRGAVVAGIASQAKALQLQSTHDARRIVNAKRNVMTLSFPRIEFMEFD